MTNGYVILPCHSPDGSTVQWGVRRGLLRLVQFRLTNECGFLCTFSLFECVCLTVEENSSSMVVIVPSDDTSIDKPQTAGR